MKNQCAGSGKQGDDVSLFQRSDLEEKEVKTAPSGILFCFFKEAQQYFFNVRDIFLLRPILREHMLTAALSICGAPGTSPHSQDDSIAYNVIGEKRENHSCCCAKACLCFSTTWSVIEFIQAVAILAQAQAVLDQEKADSRYRTQNR